MSGPAPQRQGQETARGTRQLATDRLPAQVAAVLEPGEAVEAAYELTGRLEIYGTTRRLLCKRGDVMTALGYETIKDLRYRTPLGIPQIGLGAAFLGAGAIMGFGDVRAVVASGLLFAIAVAFFLLGTLRQAARVEFRLESQESGRSLPLSALLFPFLLVLGSAKRYQVSGDQQTLATFHRFLAGKLAAQAAEAAVAPASQPAPGRAMGERSTE